MCVACSFRSAPYFTLPVTQIINNSATRDNLISMTNIDSQAFKNGDLKSLMLFTFCAAPQKLKAAFKKYNLDVNTKEEVEALAELNKRGIDRDKFKVNFKDVVGEITLTPAEVQTSSCQVQFMQA